MAIRRQWIGDVERWWGKLVLCGARHWKLGESEEIGDGCMVVLRIVMLYCGIWSRFLC